ncbi:hypothetical protein B0I32_15312 [Nonomuraea fuscirosea]|uniref:Uncharacterized protein n=1 Tax=Nonomuraea fuscirosea TaxID=1291556 RepID=A0A2T0LLY4_9ACTN|nr:hypothetical protein [Nonomuraea fuscirosea]PRX44056.1 hypothetical protein B0I32_15312 [Nonomuraea fuscirosea]
MKSGTEGITLANWAAKVGRSEKYIRNFWRPRDGFPALIGRQPTPHTTGPDGGEDTVSAALLWGEET